MDIKALHKCQLEVLEEVNRICERHDIKYVLFAGTSLGAVRHNGFIPWDDDLDITMLRSDYKKFIDIASHELKDDFFLQTEFSNHWPMFFTKIRINNTTFLEKYMPKDEKTHQGVYIDIFPCDNLYDNVLLAHLQFFLSKVVIGSSLNSRGYLTNNIFKKIFIQIVKKIPHEKIHRFVMNENDNNSKKVHTFFGGASAYKKSVYPRTWLVETVMTTFEDNEYPISKYAHELLSLQYGDYMVLPSVEEKKYKQHAILVDLEKPYYEYAGWRNDKKIEYFTRSIR